VDAAATGAKEGWADIGVAFPWEVDEVSTGRSVVDTEPIVGPCPDATGTSAEATPLPPISEGGMKGPAATWVAPKGFGIAWFGLPMAEADTELVVVRSANARLPRAVHPETAAVPANRPVSATVLSTIPAMRIFISPLVRRYSMEPRLGC